MLKDSTYQQKFVLLSSWIPTITASIKKDIKNEHLKQPNPFTKRYFPSKNLTKITVEELAEGYRNAIQNDENGESIAAWVAQRWLLKKTDLYIFFEQKLSAINPQFDEIEKIEGDAAKKIISEATEQFGALDTYLFSIINGVVFSEEDLQKLEKEAKKGIEIKSDAKLATDEEKSISKLTANYEQQIARLSDKYEKKLQGLERKYLIDTDSLKKQIVALQRKLSVNVGA